MDDQLRRVIETPAYLAGYGAFDHGSQCTHADGSDQARQWWQGWQVRAGEFIEYELEVTKL